MRLRANSVWQMLEFVFNGMVFLMLGLQLRHSGNLDYRGERRSKRRAVDAVYRHSAGVRRPDAGAFRLALDYAAPQQAPADQKPMEFSSYSTRELLIASFAGVRGAITLAGVLSIPLFLPNGDAFPGRYELVFLATGVILFSLFVGVILLPVLLRGIDGIDKSVHRRELQQARAVMAGAAVESLYKMEERLTHDAEENIDNELLKEVSSRVIGNLRRRADGQSDTENAHVAEDLERRFRLTALRAERAELYHLRATQQISNETMQKLLRDLDLLEALLVEKEEH